MVQILVPISGQSVFFPPEEYYFSKPLVEVANVPMIELVVRALARDIPDARFIAVVDRHEVAEFSIDRILKDALGPKTIVIERPGPTSGALSSCLLAVDVIDTKEPIVVVNSDQVIDAELHTVVRAFHDADAAAGIVTFPSSHPRWSYALLDEGEHVVQAAEKRVISREAIAGFYYFSSGALFVESAMRAIAAGSSSDGAFYLSAAINEVILTGQKVARHSVRADQYHSFYSPSKIDEFERTETARTMRRWLTGQRTSVNVVVPAAGRGSRFDENGWRKPKPFIDVNGRMMLTHVLENVAPRDSNQIVLLRREHLETYPVAHEDVLANGASIEIVDNLTEGTASTILLARERFDSPTPLLIANSDQLVDFDVDDFVDDCLRRGLDGSILVFRDPELNPKWSFARVNDDELVVEVAEKNPISDLATVGIYLFARGDDFVRGAVDMISRNERVNGEFYTAPIYNHLIAAGKRIGVYEIGADDMHGLGTPSDLLEYLSSINAPASADAPGPA